jgi:Domain of unknown function (DUF4157)
MDRETQASMERGFGVDFSRVRIHSDAGARRASEALNAEAFTFGRDIYFAAGCFVPDSKRGRHLLAHELAHTIQQGQSRPLRRSASHQGVTGLVDRPEETAQREESAPLGNETVAPVEATIQRSATWKGAAVHETLNLADVILGGALPATWAVLNGKKLDAKSVADAAIKPPGVTTSGSGKHWTAKIGRVPDQEGGADETVLAPGPWAKTQPKATVRAALGLAACAGTGDTTFSAHGKPSDDAVYKANRNHEDHHVDDDKVAFDEAIEAWDAKVQEAKNKGTEFNGQTAAAATAALWAAMGNTPKDAAWAYATQASAKGTAYHTTAAGGKMSATNPAANTDCSTTSVDVTNPA